jgi:nitrogen PTS system EIIA component
MIALANYVDGKVIKFLDATSRNDIIVSLVEALEDAGKLHDKDLFYRAILNREKIVSTGVGMGVAIPHAKLPSYNDFFIAIGIIQNDGVDWNALDETPVRLVFLVGGPDDKQTQYLQILSKITQIIKDDEQRKKILSTDSAEKVLALFSDI